MNQRNKKPLNYNNRIFHSKENTPNGEVDARTRFDYHQKGALVWAEYEGGDITQGHLLGTADSEGTIDFCYHHVNLRGEIRAGQCTSTPQLLPDGRLRMVEAWRWFTGDASTGQSIIEEAS